MTSSFTVLPVIRNDIAKVEFSTEHDGRLSPALKALSFVTHLSNFIKELGIE
jgi:hypothetical protein